MKNAKIKVGCISINVSSLNNSMCGPCRFRDFGGSGPGNYCMVWDKALRGSLSSNKHLDEIMEDFRNTYRCDDCLENEMKE